jgi:hypothetical protein
MDACFPVSGRVASGGGTQGLPGEGIFRNFLRITDSSFSAGAAAPVSGQKKSVAECPPPFSFGDRRNVDIRSANPPI